MVTKGSVTITDIAKAAGVSIATVSRVLNDRGGKIPISDVTKARVLGLARDLGYEANPFATGLRRGHSGVIGAVVREIADPFLTELTRAVEVATWNHGWNILVGHAEFDDTMVHRHVNLMVNGLFDGLVLIGSLVDAHDLLSRVSERRMPAVSIAAGNGSEIPAIEVDNALGASLVVEHLVGLGHRKIGFLGSLDLPGVQARLETTRSELARRGLPLPPELVAAMPNVRSQAIEAAMSVLALAGRPTAIICSSDNLALGVISAAWRSGLNVPGDLSVVGFDDVEEAALSYPPLTTARQPIDQMGKRAISALQRLVSGDRRVQHLTIVPAELVLRGTTAPPAGGARRRRKPRSELA